MKQLSMSLSVALESIYGRRHPRLVYICNYSASYNFIIKWPKEHLAFWPALPLTHTSSQEDASVKSEISSPKPWKCMLHVHNSSPNSTLPRLKTGLCPPVFNKKILGAIQGNKKKTTTTFGVQNFYKGGTQGWLSSWKDKIGTLS